MDHHHGQCRKIWCQLQTYKCQVCVSVEKKNCLILCFLICTNSYRPKLLLLSFLPYLSSPTLSFSIFLFSLFTPMYHGCIDGWKMCMNKWTEGRHGWVDGWMDGQMEGQIDGQTKHRHIDRYADR
jgi:hypothetical protein